MKFSNIISIVPLLALASAAPKTLHARDGNKAGCYYYYISGQDYYVVDTAGPWANDWGKGLLDNLRGQCGDITFWTFTYADQSGGDGSASFYIDSFADDNCVENAVWLASDGTGAIDGLSCTKTSAPKERSVPLQSRESNQASCLVETRQGAEFYTVFTKGQWATDYGHGLLDNLRAQCGNVDSWGFSYNDQANGDGSATFDIFQDDPSNCVENAIWLASDPTGAIDRVKCSPPKLPNEGIPPSRN